MTVCWRSPVLVSSRRPCRPAIVGDDWPRSRSGPRLGGAVRVEVGEEVGGQPGRREDGEDDRRLPERPGAAGEPDLVDPGRGQRPEVLRRCSSGPSRASRARRRDTSSGSAPRAPGRRPGRSRRRCTAPVGSNEAAGARRTRRARPRARRRARQRAARSRRGTRARRSLGHEASCDRLAPSVPDAPAGGASAAPGTTRPGPVRGCARPKCPADSGQGSHCRAAGSGP